MAQSNEEHSVKELAQTEVEPLTMKDLSQKSDDRVQQTDWKSLYEDMQKTQIEMEETLKTLTRMQLLEDRQDQLELKQSRLVETSAEKKSVIAPSKVLYIDSPSRPKTPPRIQDRGRAPKTRVV